MTVLEKLTGIVLTQVATLASPLTYCCQLAGDFLSSLGWQAGKHLIAKPADKLQELDRNKRGQYADNVYSNLAALPFLPPLLLWERKVTARVPNSYPAAGTFLLKRVGYHFPLLGKLRHARTIKALTTVVRDNLEPSQCNLPPATKLLCGIVFATKAKNKILAADMKRCALHLGPHLLPGTCELVARFADDEVDFQAPTITLSDTVLREAGADLTLADRRALLLAKAGSTSPSTIGPVVLGGMEELFSPAAMIEQLVWLGICALLNRLYIFYLDPEIAPEARATAPHVPEPTEAKFYAGPSGGINLDEVRATSTLQDELEAAAAGRPSNVTQEDHDKGSIVRQDGPGGRLVLQGAEPVYLDESFADNKCDGRSDGVSERPREAVGGFRAPLFRHREYVEEDILTRITPEVSVGLPPRPPLPRPLASLSISGECSNASTPPPRAASELAEQRRSLCVGRTLPFVHPDLLDGQSSSGDEGPSQRASTGERTSPRLGDRRDGSSSRPGSTASSPRSYRGTAVDGGVVFPVGRSRGGGNDGRH